MFSINGTAVFTEADMFLGEQLEQTLKNEGFAVKKEYILHDPAQLVLQFMVNNRDEHKAGTEFKMN